MLGAKEHVTMKLWRAASILALLMLAGSAAWAQDTLTLGRTTTAAKIDGIISAKEYTLTADSTDMQLSLSWIADTLFIGVSGQTTGWVAIGLGSPVMDSAIMYLGYVSGDKTSLKVQQGAGHRHGDVDANAPLKYAMKEANGRTVMEIAVKAASFIAKGQKELEVILALGGGDSFTAMHRSRYSTRVTLSP
jgi:hypothetical protein